MPELVLASFNVHGGVNGWGQPFDVVGACRALAADVLVLQEMWAPGDGELGADVADALGYDRHVLPMARGVMHPPIQSSGDRWGPPRRRRAVGLRLDSLRPASARSTATRRRRAGAAAGRLGLVLLSRLPVRSLEHVELGRLLGDLCRRGALVAEIGVGERSLFVAGTHMPHLRQGSIVQFRRLRRALATSGTRPVVMGDMNLWGPPLELLFPSWRRAVRGRTWPAWRPIAQPDHVLVPRGLEVRDPAIVRVGDSDHLAVRATVVVE